MANTIIDKAGLAYYHEKNVELIQDKADTAEGNAKSAAQGYANTAESNAKSHADTVAGTAETNAKEAAQGYANTAEANAKAYVDAEDIFTGDLLTVNALGGIGAGVSLEGKTTHEILDMLLFPYVAQTVGKVTAKPNNGGTFEKGDNKTITSATVTVTKKSKAITKVELLKGSEVVATKEGDAVKAGGTITFSDLNIPVNSVNVQLKAKAYDETNNAVTGENSDAFTFVYPYYYGICEVGAEINEALVEGLTKDIKSKGQKTYTYTTNNQCCVVAYPKAHGVLTSALDPNGFENIGSFTKSEVSVTGLDGTAQTYYVYVSGAGSVSGFKYTFKH